MFHSISTTCVLSLAMLFVASRPIQAEDTPGTSDSAAAEAPDSDAPAAAQEKPEKMQDLLVADDHLQLTLPARWKQAERRSQIIEFEFVVPAKQEKEDGSPARDKPEGRLTMMSAGGDVEANIERWIGQFRVGQNAEGEEAIKRDRMEVDAAVIHTLDIEGTMFDSPGGPFGPKVERPDYRMLAAIVEAEGMGKYFIKFYGPEPLVAANEKAFQDMLASLEVKIAGVDSETTPE